MPTIQANCPTCGALVEVQAAAPIASAAVVGAFCPACSDQLFLDQGGAVFTLRRELDGARFPLGKVTITPGAVGALAEASQHAVEFLLRHVRSDWGEFGQCDQIALTADEQRRGWEATDDSGKINKSNLRNWRDEIMSEYTVEPNPRRGQLMHTALFPG